MAIFLIVHGGFSGGWSWRAVANRLRSAGHEVFTPTLTGLGERAHLASPTITLETHILDIAGVLTCEDIRGVMLVGHSSGAMVVTGVAERVPERIACLAYIDTAVPRDGQSWLDVLGPEMARTLLAHVSDNGNGAAISLIDEPPRYQPHPLQTVAMPLTVANPQAGAIPRAYIHCTARSSSSPLAPAWPAIDRAAEEARQQGWWYRSLPTDHSPHRTMPDELAALLLELARDHMNASPR